MQFASTEPPRRLALDVRSIGLTDETFYQLCRDNPELRLELTSRGELILMSPSGAQTGHRESRIIQHLANWADEDGTGIAFSSSAGFTLPNGAKRAPDASWILRQRWDALSPDEQSVFAPVCPDFVVELRSPGDSRAELLEKMDEYLSSGARLGWILDPIDDAAWVCRPGQASERIEHPEWLDGGDVLPGFRFDFSRII